MVSRGARWLGFHLFAPEPYEPLLVRCFAPLVEPGGRDPRARRFFFLRYGEGGSHLRLRVVPGRGVEEDGVAALLDERVRVCLRPGEWRLEAHPYDRTALYFGETRESVYSELLNEATSVLALRLLAAPGATSRTARWLALAALLDVLLRESTTNRAAWSAELSASRKFAREIAESLGHPIADAGDSRPPNAAADAALRRARERMALLASDAEVRRTARLLSRVRRCGPRGALAGTHALHLLCNKVGFTIPEEHDLFTALARLAAEAHGRAAPPTARSAR